MKVEWRGTKCLLCLGEKPLSEEHIIPEALGGKLICEFLCRDCNSKCGAKLEAKAKTDPSIRIAVEKLRPLFPNELTRKLTEDQSYITVGAGPTSRGYIQNNEFKVRPQKLVDGSLIQPPAVARKSIETMLVRQGVPESQIQDLLGRFDAAAINERVLLAQGIEVANWATDAIRVDLNGARLMSALVPLKIGFEFLACHMSLAVYGSASQLGAIRNTLREMRESDPCFRVERLNAADYKPFHGICFEGNNPYATVLIRLFGWLAFRVHFLRLSISGPRFVYTHYLDSGKEIVHELVSAP